MIVISSNNIVHDNEPNERVNGRTCERVRVRADVRVSGESVAGNGKRGERRKPNTGLLTLFATWQFPVKARKVS